jgi:SAM-dependent methyltransferase
MAVKVAVRESIRRATPWWAKGALKLTFAKLPLGYSILRTFALAQHGGMENPRWAFDAFHRHFDNAQFHNKAGGFTMLELGPGDSLFSAIIAKAYGARASWFVDVGPFVNTDLRLYRQMADFLRQRGLPAPDLSAAETFQEVLDACNARYLIHGLESLRTFESQSLDYIFSNGVLQSIWLDDVAPTLKELRRIIHPEGDSVHSVDLRDTMGQSLNHLRFSDEWWESEWFRTAGFYTNRLRLSQLCDLCRDAGFEPVLDEINRFPRLPLGRQKLAERYQSVSDDDLMVSTIRLILRPAKENVQ